MIYSVRLGEHFFIFICKVPAFLFLSTFKRTFCFKICDGLKFSHHNLTFGIGHKSDIFKMLLSTLDRIGETDLARRDTLSIHPKNLKNILMISGHNVEVYIIISFLPQINLNFFLTEKLLY